MKNFEIDEEIANAILEQTKKRLDILYEKRKYICIPKEDALAGAIFGIRTALSYLFGDAGECYAKEAERAFYGEVIWRE